MECETTLVVPYMHHHTALAIFNCERSDSSESSSHLITVPRSTLEYVIMVVYSQLSPAVTYKLLVLIFCRLAIVRARHGDDAF
jgi:hypothetical protein